MRVCVCAGQFPVRSQTFVIQHVIGLLDRNVDVQVLGNQGDQEAWTNLDGYIDALSGRVWNYRMPRSKLARVPGVFKLALRNAAQGNYRYFHSWNLLRFKRDVVTLRFPFLYDVALQLGPVDVLHCHFGPIGVLGSYLKALGLAKKLVVTFHGFDVSRVLQGGSQNHPYKELFRQADLLLPISDRWKEKLIELGAPEERVVTHRMGVDLRRFAYREHRPPKPNQIRIVTTARFVEKKGLEYAIQAIARVRSLMPELSMRYDLIGEGPLLQSIRLLIDQYGLQEIVQLHGALPNEEVRSLLDQSDLFMLPSVTAKNGDQEGIPVALMEAMASGMPVLSTHHSGIPELIEDGRSGFLVPERDVGALAERIIFLARNANQWPELGRAGREKVMKDYNVERLNDDLVAMYHSLF